MSVRFQQLENIKHTCCMWLNKPREEMQHEQINNMKQKLKKKEMKTEIRKQKEQMKEEARKQK